jgi:hypothetical protein
MASDTPQAAPAAAKEKKPEQPKVVDDRSLRRCAKCSRRCADREFKTEKGEFTPYCTDCRKRHPSLKAPHCTVRTVIQPKAARKR